MAVKRIVANVGAENVTDVRRFYADLFGLTLVMDHGWIATLSAAATSAAQISIASEGGSGTPVPDISIEVDDVDETYAAARRIGCPIAYELTDEAWGVRRFFVRDPTGKLLNVLAHLDPPPT